MSSEDQYAILAAKTNYREAYNTGDVERLLSVFAPEFTDCSDGEPTFYGDEAPRALRARVEKLFRSYTIELAVIVVDVVVEGQRFAYDWGWHKVRLIDKQAGVITNTKYRYFETWLKDGAQWKISYMITNQELPSRMLANESAQPGRFTMAKSGQI
ncbi:MAG TPA: nuclear transport factor 2 family protein [Candidatus Saccharimonadales bacterium]|jgi:ketosteroid isomerase-like protein|nr:nuclear transport factor 2 family protein [Candidatus Saccharimonadales bacterium]